MSHPAPRISSLGLECTVSERAARALQIVQGVVLGELHQWLCTVRARDEIDDLVRNKFARFVELEIGRR